MPRTPKRPIVAANSVSRTLNLAHQRYAAPGRHASDPGKPGFSVLTMPHGIAVQHRFPNSVLVDVAQRDRERGKAIDAYAATLAERGYTVTRQGKGISASLLVVTPA